MKRILNVAYYTFLEMVRNKVLFILFFFALFIFGLGIVITQMTIGDNLTIISDVGLATIEIFLTVLSIFLGISLVQKELSQKTLFPLMARPLSRAEYILGKFFGMMLLIIIVKHPEKADLFSNYINIQKEEYDNLKFRVIGATMVLKRKSAK